jgi:hypothetical protein
MGFWPVCQHLLFVCLEFAVEVLFDSRERPPNKFIKTITHK